MKYSSIASLLLLTSMTSTMAFVVVGSSSNTQLSATVERTELVSPVPLTDLMNQEGATAQAYDESVQKTYGRYPLTISHGQGCRLYTAGTPSKDYLDFVSGIATCALGHSNPALSAAVQYQMMQVHHVSNLYLIPAQAALADWLCANSCCSKAFFCNSGAEANEAAIKLARKHAHDTRDIAKPVIITAKQSFHGRTLAAISATGQPKYHAGFEYDGTMVPGFEYVTYNDVEDLRAKVKEIEDADDGRGLAGILMECLQGEGGIIPGDVEFFQAVRDICDDTGALMMCDEVQIGMGRSGKLWGYQNLPGIEPDVITSAKALGGGVPIGAMLANAKCADTLGPGTHASTYGGNPLACAAGLAVAQYLCDHDVLTNVQERGDQLVAGLEQLATQYPQLLTGQVRGWGLLRGAETVVGAGPLVQAAMDQGLLLVAAGPNVVRFVPPLIVSEAEVTEALEKFAAALEEAAQSAE